MRLVLALVLGSASSSAFARLQGAPFLLPTGTPVATCALKVAERYIAKSAFPQIQIDTLVETERLVDFFDRLNDIHRFRLKGHDAQAHRFGGEVYVQFSPIVLEDPLSGQRDHVRTCFAAWSGPSVIVRNVNGTRIINE